ncbi:anti-sigma F factor [uncultured Eubacterium sp.]|mgnify:CR=1 FL=1|jgi:anti-sigma F factor|uniref:anti-sigma F factor n=1 Tax=uncultured Eubacterium sp. TaxID=165185 RepID=UPI002627F162|nr:anti-sigma F factor [uncultured Eubacterium sp.]
MDNNMSIVFDAKSQNEGLARIAIAAFVTELDPTVEEINDIKTAVSEAVTNSIIHGYNEGPGKIYMKCSLTINEAGKDALLRIEIKDDGIGIEDIDKAREPLFTTKPELERSGMGFMFMEMFMDDIQVASQKYRGTTVIMTKKIKNNKSR